MGHDAEEHETRIARLERTVYGGDDSRDGLSARMHLTETTLEKIDATLSKLNWLIIAGVVVGILNLILSKPGSGPAPAQSTSVITGDAAADPTKAALLGTHRDYLQ